MSVTVVVVTHNSAAVVGAALDSLPAALDGLAASVVVVDNGSTDETVAVLRARQDCVVVQQRNEGYAAGVNAGVAATPGTGPILVLNPDVRCRPGSVRSMVAASEEHRAIVAPLMTDDDGARTASLRRRPTPLRVLGLGLTRLPAFSEAMTADADYSRGQYVSWATGAALLVPRECHERLGGWDESYFLYSEETDLCLRAADRGWGTWFEPTAVVSHTGQASGWNVRLYCMQIVNRVRLYARRHGAPAGWAYFGCAVLREVGRAARGDAASAAAARALVWPPARPAELDCAGSVLPR